MTPFKRALLILLSVIGLSVPVHAQLGAIYGRAEQPISVTSAPIRTVVLGPIAYGQIRVCQSGATGSPCSPVASIFDNFGNPLTVVGGNFGQLTTDVTGFYSFQCSTANYVIQIAASASNTPQQTFNASCPVVGVNSLLNTNNTFTGTTTFQNTVTLGGGSCTVAGLQLAIAAISAGTVDARPCTTISTNITNATGSIAIPANVTVLLGPSTWTCTITTANTPCWWEKGALSPQLIGAGAGQNQAGADPGTSAANGTTNLLCSSCGTTTDMILVENPTRTGALSNFLVQSAVVKDLWINMGLSGREPLYAISTDDSTYTDLQMFNAVCPSAPCGAFHLAAGISTDSPTTPQAYRNTVDRIVAQAAASNSTGANCFLDARYGEIAYASGLYNSFCMGNNANGGGLYGLLIQASNGAIQDSLDTFDIKNSHIGNPVASASSYGIRLEAPGNWSNGTGGRIFNLSVETTLIERLFVSATGTAIGCTNGGTSNGAGCGELHLYNTSINFGNWAVAQDNTTTNNPIGEYVTVGVLGSQSGGHPTFYSTGSKYGANSVSFRGDATWNASANGQSGFTVWSLPSINKGAFTGLGYQHFLADIGDGTYTGAGTLTSLFGYKCNGSFGTIHTVTAIQTNCFLEVGGDPNSFDGPFYFTEAGAPGGLAGSTAWYADSTLHMPKANYNNNGFFPIPQTGNVSGTHSDSGFYQTATASGCTTAASIGGICATAITITWPTAFADANYKVNCTPVGAPTNLPSNPYIVTPIAASVTVNYYAITAAAASWPTVTCEAVHN